MVTESNLKKPSEYLLLLTVYNFSKPIPNRKQYEKEAIKRYRSARSVLMGMILR
jgi:hypothetical protein